jgi:hypothetical protein
MWLTKGDCSLGVDLACSIVVAVSQVRRDMDLSWLVDAPSESAVRYF